MTTNNGMLEFRDFKDYIDFDNLGAAIKLMDRITKDWRDKPDDHVGSLVCFALGETVFKLAEFNYYHRTAQEPENEDTKEVSDETDRRYRPRSYINTMRLTLERGDGECVDVGEPPNFENLTNTMRFLLHLENSCSKLGRYNNNFMWSPRKLEFHISDPVSNSHND
jgi:hypothetical protein